MTILQYLGGFLGFNYDSKKDNKMLRLRAHHISALDNYVTSQKKDPKARAYVERIHGPKVLAKLDELSDGKNRLVKIVDGSDDLCQVCSLSKPCEKKQYYKIEEIARRAGEEVFGEPRYVRANPEELDQDVSELLEIKPGEIYSLYVLLKKWKKNAMFLLNVKQKRRFRQFKDQAQGETQ